ncbi:phosphoglycerate mutase-like protein [Morchella conica CCBAS932]|uniref:Phosphoglycerate mutase-like protein n=1 Tax=Morchella conica CCBAS932 TaxID=1392247 RepID=A0A3N4KF57_9PEZI|nr:phosphoglycerate mutase-like protein [Morchella conica CCBAS932]
MLYSLTLSLPLLLLPLGVQAATETVHGAVIFSRHGDRSAKVFPPTKLTALGKNQLYDSGEFYRSRYIGNSSTVIPGISYREFNSAQLYAEAPDQNLLVTSGQAFLQGLYPPITGSSAAVTTETLANGSVISLPLAGYQYTTIHTVSESDPSTIWLKGDDGCPDFTAKSEEFYLSEQYLHLQDTTKSFYESFSDILEGVFSSRQLSYHNAYAIYDYINVGSIHNATIADAVSSEQLFQLRTLADSHELGLNGNTSSTSTVALISGRTLANKIITQLSTVVDSKGEDNKLSLLVGSYDTFLSFFALSGLSAAYENFTGLPDYASTLAFELLSYQDNAAFPRKTEDLYVRFLFRNGTNSDIKEYPLFGNTDVVVSWNDFNEKMASIAVDSVSEWCTLCSSDESICSIDSDKSVDTADTTDTKSGGISKAVAGVIGALVALAVVGLVLAVAMIGCGLRFVSRKNNADAVVSGGVQKSAVDDFDSERSVKAVFPNKV